jgi:riboflavin synthase
MFTGLIESVGTIATLAPVSGGFRLSVRTDLADQLTPGESVSVNGVCLTATVAGDGEMQADVGAETARITTLGSLRPGGRVNLERALRADGRFGGHFVQGHVDGTGTIEKTWQQGETRWIAVRFSSDLAAGIVAKGSIAVDGVSLTVATLGDGRFEVMIIPFTWEHTNLSGLQAGDRVNLECDMVGKYVARAAELFAAGRRNPSPASDV